MMSSARPKRDRLRRGRSITRICPENGASERSTALGFRATAILQRARASVLNRLEVENIFWYSGKLAGVSYDHTASKRFDSTITPGL